MSVYFASQVFLLAGNSSSGGAEHYGCSVGQEFCVAEAKCEERLKSETTTGNLWECVCPEGALGDGQKGADHTGCRYRRFQFTTNLKP